MSRYLDILDAGVSSTFIGTEFFIATSASITRRTLHTLAASVVISCRFYKDTHSNAKQVCVQANIVLGWSYGSGSAPHRGFVRLEENTAL